MMQILLPEIVVFFLPAMHENCVILCRANLQGISLVVQGEQPGLTFLVVRTANLVVRPTVG